MEKMENKWIPVKKDKPTVGVVVWCYDVDSESIFLGCLMSVSSLDHDGEDLVWAKSDGVLLVENGVIVSDCYVDDLVVTHWCDLVPALPKIIAPKASKGVYLFRAYKGLTARFYFERYFADFGEMKTFSAKHSSSEKQKYSKLGRRMRYSSKYWNLSKEPHPDTVARYGE
jgi:hypothetical protein